MEFLFVGLIEFALPLLLGAVSVAINVLLLMVDLTFLVAGLIASAFGYTIDRRKTGGGEAAAEEKGPKVLSPEVLKRRLWAKRILAGAAALLLLLLSTVAVLNSFYFESVTRWMFGQVEKRAGIGISFDKAEGSIWTGRFHLINLKAQRASHPLSVFEVTLDSIDLDISMTSLMRRKIVFESLNISGVAGSFEQTGLAEKGEATKKKKMKPRRAFQLHNFQLTDVDINYKNLTLAQPFVADFKLASLSSEKISSDWFVVDILFLSNAEGYLLGVPFSIKNENGPDGAYLSQWRCDNMPVAALSIFMGGPFKWFESGFIDVNVQNKGKSEEDPTIVMDWDLVFHDFKAGIPDDVSPTAQIWAPSLVAYLNDKSENLALGFRLDLTPEDMKFASTDDLVALLKKRAGQELWEYLYELGQSLAPNFMKKIDFRKPGPARTEAEDSAALPEKVKDRKPLRSLLKGKPGEDTALDTP